MSVYQRTILIVEDEESDQVFIKKAFRENGVTGPIRCADSGEEAIQYLMGEGRYADREQYPFPSFIMLDLKMPHGDGFAVLEHLKGNPEWAIIPTVVLTSSQDPDDIHKAYILGASSYHVKPHHYEELCKQLKILHDYWMTCLIPDIDVTGRRLRTESKGKLGERFAQPAGGRSTGLSKRGFVVFWRTRLVEMRSELHEMLD